MTQLDKQVKKAEQAEDEKAFRWIVTREPAVFAALFFDLELDQYQVDLLNHARNNRRSLILLPKGHGKSTLVSKILPILELCTNPNVRIILIMKTQEESAAYSSTIRNELMENKQLISTFGQFHNPLSWSNQTFNIKQRQITDPHYSLEIYGEKGRYLGHRSDITICYDDQTEVLTQDGFKPFRKLLVTDRVATLSSKGYLEYQSPTNYIAHEHNGELYEFNGESIDFAVTPGHKMYVARRAYPSGWSDFSLEPVDDLYGSGSLSFKKDCCWSGEPLGAVTIPEQVTEWVSHNNAHRKHVYPELVIDAADLYALIGFWLAEGSYLKTRGRRTALRFSQNEGPELRQLRQLLQRVGLAYKDHAHTSGGSARELVVHDTRLAEWFYERLGDGSKSKYISPELLRASRRELSALVEWYLLGDGCDSGYTPYLATSSKRLADGLFEAALKCGYAPRLAERPASTMCSPSNGKTYHTSAHFTISLASAKNTPSIAYAANRGGWKKTPYTGMVYCVSVPNHTLYVRRNGASFWCGNCDDIVTEENSYTRDGREKLKAKFETGIQTGPQYMWTLANANCKWEESSSKLRIPKGIYWPTDINYERIIVCGTRFHPQDLYNKLEHDASYKNLYFDCWTDGEMTKPLWPKMWTKQKLDAEKKSLGTLSFNKRYRNIALDESELGFRHEWFYGGERDGEVFAGCLNNGRSWGEHSDKWYKAVGFDPASGSTSRFSTFPSFVCAGIDKDDPREDKPRYLIDIFRQQTGFDDLIDVMLDGKPGKLPGFRRLYDYDLLVVEANAYGTYFIDNNRIKRAQTLGLRVEPHYTGRNKTDPTDGVMSMQGIVKQGLLDIPYKTDADKRKTDDFLEQWLIFPKGIYDYLMAFWFVELKFRKSLSKRKAHVKSNPYKFGRISNPFYSRRPSGTP